MKLRQGVLGSGVGTATEEGGMGTATEEDGMGTLTEAGAGPGVGGRTAYISTTSTRLSQMEMMLASRSMIGGRAGGLCCVRLLPWKLRVRSEVYGIQNTSS